MFCPRCGAENAAGSRYCASCGADLPQEAADPGPAKPEQPSGLGERFAQLVGSDRRTRLVTLGTVAAIAIAVVAFIALDASSDDGGDVPQDAYTRALDTACVQRKGEIAKAQGAALSGGGLAAVGRYADRLGPIVGAWRLELKRSGAPADRAELVAALEAALLEVQIEAGALARVADEGNSKEVQRTAARVDAATANVETAIAELELERCSGLAVAAGQLVDQ